MRLNRFVTALTAAAVLLSVSQVLAGKFNSKLNIGDKAPDFKNLAGIDEKQHSLADYKDADVVVVCFTRNLCPVAAAYSQRLAAFAEKYQGRKVALVAICVNYEGPETEAPSVEKQVERNAKFASEHNWKFDYLYDQSQQSALEYGAVATPHVFVLDKERKVAYMGAIDNNWNEVEGVETSPYLKTAVDALLSGSEIEETETRPVGCPIELRKAN